MSSRCLILASCVCLGLLYLASLTEAMGYLDCCYSYSKKPLPLKVIRNYTVQRSSDVCDMDAIIFHTKKKFNVCANPQDQWVKAIIKALSMKNKNKRLPGKNRKAGSRKQG